MAQNHTTHQQTRNKRLTSNIMDLLLSGYGSNDENDDDDAASEGGGGGGGEENNDDKKPKAGAATKDDDDDDDDDEEEQTNDSVNPPQRLAQRADRRFLKAAPTVSLTASSRMQQQQASLEMAIDGGGGGGGRMKQGDLVLWNNPTKATLYQPVQGPQLDLTTTQQQQQQQQQQNQIVAYSKTTTAGGAQLEPNVAFEDATFQEQRNAFARSGRALAPSDSGHEVVRTTLGYNRDRLQKFAERQEQDEARLLKRQKLVKENGKDDALVVGSDDEAEFGVWGPPTLEERWTADNALTDIAKAGVESLAPEQLAEREYIKERNRQRGIVQEERESGDSSSAFDRILERKMAHLLPPPLRGGDADKPCEATSKFHASQEFDYQGRSWTAPPAGMGAIVTTTTTAGSSDSGGAGAGNNSGNLEMDHHKCIVPKKCVARLSGHGNKGVHRIRLFPRTGHLLLSAGLDGTCRVWNVAQKQLMRTYSGHSAGVRDVQFNHNGSRFVSASFDRYLRLWDTESGEVMQTFCNRKVPYVVKFYPHDDNFFVVGCSDNKIVTYNATTAEITQEYNHHLAPVNAILFVEDNGTKMVTSSDDKKILVWEWVREILIIFAWNVSFF
jgi:pre-mRNA-processing factor 17